MNAFETDFLQPFNAAEASQQGKKTLARSIGEAHAELLFLHPFREGNGRTSRLLAVMQLLQATGKLVSFKTFEYEGRVRLEYIRAVQEAGKTNYKPMVSLFDEALSNQL